MAVECMDVVCTAAQKRVVYGCGIVLCGAGPHLYVAILSCEILELQITSKIFIPKEKLHLSPYVQVPDAWVSVYECTCDVRCTGMTEPSTHINTRTHSICAEGNEASISPGTERGA